MFRNIALLVFAGMFVSSAAALADPCTAIPDNGPAPAYLAQLSPFSGQVVEVIDGDSLCVAVGPRIGDDWVEVRLADFYAPELSSAAGADAKAALKRIAYGKQATCIAGAQTHDRIAAWCRINGRPIGELLTAAGIRQGGMGTYDTSPRGTKFKAPAPAGLSCAELRARGGARRGEPGYREDWDGDHDGIACEPYHH